MEAGTIVRWLKSEGDAVAKGEALFELDTDKVTQEVEAEAEGVLLKIVVSEGEVNVGTTVGVIGAGDEDVTELLTTAQEGNGAAPAEAPQAEGDETAEKEAEEESKPDAPSDVTGDVEPQGEVEPQRDAEQPAQAVADPDSPTPRASGERVKASPLARRIARERGIDLGTLTGSGPEGRVVAEDVEQAASTPATAPSTVAAPSAAPGEVEVVQLTSVRKTIARRLTEAWEAPVFQLTVIADASELIATRERLVDLMREGEVKPTVNDVLTRIVASALMRHRPVNAQFVEGEIHRHPTASVGIAVATANGLVVPVVRDAQTKSIQEIAGVRADLVERSRTSKLQLADLEGGTFTISNLGMYGIDQFIAVLNPPQVAILAVGAIEDRPLVVEGELVIAPVLTMTLTCDHRAIDGSEGAEFLQTVKAYVETPALAL